jgi:hypothetical protein
MEVVVSSWNQYLLGVERLTKNEKDVIDKLRDMHIGQNPPDTWISLSADSEILKKRIRAVHAQRLA